MTDRTTPLENEESLVGGPTVKLVEAMVDAVLHDGTVTAAEAELLRAACGSMHVPLSALWAERVAQ